MPTPFSGAAATDATAVPWNSPAPVTVSSLRNDVFGRPASSGCVGSAPLSTIVIGTPGPGGATWSAPMRDNHHSCPWSGSPATRPVAADAGPHTQSAATSAMSRRRRTGAWRVAVRSVTVPRAYVALGSNLGDRERTLREALGALGAEDGVEIVAVSSLIETAPVGVIDQPHFLNGVAALETERSARGLLDLLLDVEGRFGRSREGVPAQGPRTLDLDLLLYGDAEIDEPGLRIPHPRMHERAFVLGPLAELEPDLQVPGKGSIQTLLGGLH